MIFCSLSKKMSNEYHLNVIQPDNHFERVDLGAAGTVLTSNGTGSAPTFQAVSELENQEFDDEEFRVHDDGDNTRKLAFQCSSISTATTRTVTIPDKSGTMAMISDIGSVFLDSDFTVQDNADNTKQMQFDCSSISTMGTRTLTIQNSSGTIAYQEEDSTPFLNQYWMKVGKGTTQSISTGTATQVTYDVLSDSDAAWYQFGSVWASNTFTAPLNGYYNVHACIYWASNSSGSRRIAIIKQGTLGDRVVASAHTFPAATGSFLQNAMAESVRLNGDDTLHVEVSQSSGGNLTIGNSTSVFTEAQVPEDYNFFSVTMISKV